MNPMDADTLHAPDPYTPFSGRSAQDLLPAGLTMGVVTLKTDDVPRLRSYYERALGLEAIAESGADVVLGRVGVPLVAIEEARGLKLPGRGEAGLYHTAIVFPDRASLAATVYQALQVDSTRFVGSSDHLVSEAFYFQDPDDNGIELYWDRPREQWEWRQGQVAMDTVYLPWDRYLREHLTEEAVAGLRTSPAQVGHVHLQVGDIETAHRFYVDALGFEQTVSMGTMALFVSAGGYHHHMAMNTWNSTGVGPRRDTLGLGSVNLTLPAGDGLGAAAERLRSAGYSPVDTGAQLEVRDPWNTLLVLTPAESSAEQD